MARMVAAGVPDMQLAPNNNPPGLISRTSNSNIAGGDMVSSSCEGQGIIRTGLVLQEICRTIHIVMHALPPHEECWKMC